MSASTIYAGLIFGAIGLAAFIYGKKQTSFKPMVIGIALMAYPYFVSHEIWVWAIGAVLTFSLFLFRD